MFEISRRRRGSVGTSWSPLRRRSPSISELPFVGARSHCHVADDAVYVGPLQWRVTEHSQLGRSLPRHTGLMPLIGASGRTRASMGL